MPDGNVSDSLSESFRLHCVLQGSIAKKVFCWVGGYKLSFCVEIRLLTVLPVDVYKNTRGEKKADRFRAADRTRLFVDCTELFLSSLEVNTFLILYDLIQAK